MAATDKLFPVTLPTWPACINCVTWSEDDIAVAGGEFVHVLSPKNPASPKERASHLQWNILSFRVNLFRQDEWPEQNLATVDDFSIGEEQSSSLVVALGWSNAGLGMHRRSVLAVLTSNLILSIWEGDGSQAYYHRTCIVNKQIANEDCYADEGGPGRRALRIRSFTWAPPLKTTKISKWGVSHLVIADDNGCITFLRPSRSTTPNSKGWNFEVDLKLNAADLGQGGSEVQHMSPLQRRLYETTPISSVELTPWKNAQELQRSNERSLSSHSSIQDELFSRLIIRRGTFTYETVVHVSVSSDIQQVSLVSLKSHQNLVLETNGFKPNILNGTLNHDRDMVKAIEFPEIYFEQVIKQLRDDFDATFQLFGHLTTRFWGSTVSADGTKAVACITLHPSDMIEYTIPSSERSTLVFKKTNKVKGGVSAFPRSALSVQKQILHFVYSELKKREDFDLTIDLKHLRVYFILVHILQIPNLEIREVLEAKVQKLASQHANTGTTQDITPDTYQSVIDLVRKPEDCEICGAKIAFTADLTRGWCDSGHVFSRCQLSFVAIQEPGISKYCSQCGKQFLDIAKLGTDRGPSFIQLVFDEFDVCPYCQAKYRG